MNGWRTVSATEPTCVLNQAVFFPLSVRFVVLAVTVPPIKLLYVTVESIVTPFAFPSIHTFSKVFA